MNTGNSDKNGSFHLCKVLVSFSIHNQGQSSQHPYHQLCENGLLRLNSNFHTFFNKINVDIDCSIIAVNTRKYLVTAPGEKPLCMETFVTHLSKECQVVTPVQLSAGCQ